MFSDAISRDDESYLHGEVFIFLEQFYCYHWGISYSSFTADLRRWAFGPRGSPQKLDNENSNTTTAVVAALEA
jgi:hypothetical protein